MFAFSHRWKTHKWHSCTVAPESVRRSLSAPTELCGNGLETRGKCSLFLFLFLSVSLLLPPPLPSNAFFFDFAHVPWLLYGCFKLSFHSGHLMRPKRPLGPSPPTSIVMETQQAGAICPERARQNHWASALMISSQHWFSVNECSEQHAANWKKKRSAGLAHETVRTFQRQSFARADKNVFTI